MSINSIRELVSKTGRGEDNQGLHKPLHIKETVMTYIILGLLLISLGIQGVMLYMLYKFTNRFEFISIEELIEDEEEVQVTVNSRAVH